MGSYRKAMMAAVREAAKPSVLFKGSSLTNAMRAIRTFERVNGLPFDPYDDRHLDTVRSMGVHEQIFRRVDRIMARFPHG